jgi:hypothetical protein
MTFIKSFLQYQQERFPLIVLIPVSLSGVMGASAVLGLHNWTTIALATCLTVAFLFHVRVIDEVRDFTHDNAYHPDRPVQKQIISIRGLKILRALSLLLFFAISLSSLRTFILAAAVFAYSALAGRDFFCPNWIRKYFYLYNLLNMVQLIGLQMVVYTMFNWDYDFNKVIVANIIMVFLLSLLLEVVRKIKLPKDETLGRDTYSDRLGFTGSITFLNIILALILLPSGYILLTRGKAYEIIIPAIFCILSIYMAVLHALKKSLDTEKILLLASAIYYLAVNVSLYIFIR